MEFEIKDIEKIEMIIERLEESIDLYDELNTDKKDLEAELKWWNEQIELLYQEQKDEEERVANEYYYDMQREIAHFQKEVI